MRLPPPPTALPLAAALLAGLMLAACAKAPAPAPATEASASKATHPHELQDAIEARDHRAKAQAAGDATLEADKKHDQELEDAGG